MYVPQYVPLLCCYVCGARNGAGALHHAYCMHWNPIRHTHSIVATPSHDYVTLLKGEHEHGVPWSRCVALWRGEQKHGAPRRRELEWCETSHLHYFSAMDNNIHAHVHAHTRARTYAHTLLFASAIAREGTLANSEPRGSGSPWTGFMYRMRAIARTV